MSRLPRSCVGHEHRALWSRNVAVCWWRTAGLGLRLGYTVAWGCGWVTQPRLTVTRWSADLGLWLWLGHAASSDGDPLFCRPGAVVGSRSFVWWWPADLRAWGWGWVTQLRLGWVTQPCLMVTCWSEDLGLRLGHPALSRLGHPASSDGDPLAWFPWSVEALVNHRVSVDGCRWNTHVRTHAETCARTRTPACMHGNTHQHTHTHTHIHIHTRTLASTRMHACALAYTYMWLCKIVISMYAFLSKHTHYIVVDIF